MGKARTSSGGKVPDRVVVQYQDSTGTHTREFTPSDVNKANPHHKGKNHLHLAKEFVASNEAKSAKIVSSVPKDEAPADAGDGAAAE